jgi:hypothetical protein
LGVTHDAETEGREGGTEGRGGEGRGGRDNVNIVILGARRTRGKKEETENGRGEGGKEERREGGREGGREEGRGGGREGGRERDYRWTKSSTLSPSATGRSWGYARISSISTRREESSLSAI